MIDKNRVLILENCLINLKHFSINDIVFLDVDVSKKLEKMGRLKILENKIEETETETVEKEVVKKTRKTRVSKKENEV